MKKEYLFYHEEEDRLFVGEEPQLFIIEEFEDKFVFKELFYVGEL